MHLLFEEAFFERGKCTHGALFSFLHAKREAKVTVLESHCTTGIVNLEHSVVQWLLLYPSDSFIKSIQTDHIHGFKVEVVQRFVGFGVKPRKAGMGELNP